MIWTIDMDDLHAKCNPRSLELSKTIHEIFHHRLTVKPHERVNISEIHKRPTLLTRTIRIKVPELHGETLYLKNLAKTLTHSSTVTVSMTLEFGNFFFI